MSVHTGRFDGDLHDGDLHDGEHVDVDLGPPTQALLA